MPRVALFLQLSHHHSTGRHHTRATKPTRRRRRKFVGLTSKSSTGRPSLDSLRLRQDQPVLRLLQEASRPLPIHKRTFLVNISLLHQAMLPSGVQSRILRGESLVLMASRSIRLRLALPRRHQETLLQLAAKPGLLPFHRPTATTPLWQAKMCIHLRRRATLPDLMRPIPSFLISPPSRCLHLHPRQLITAERPRSLLYPSRRTVRQGNRLMLEGTSQHRREIPDLA